MRVLFVDDEVNVLQGLQRMLRRYRQEWDMQFVDSGSQALGILGKEPFDVVVSDVRMPGMDGVELLTQVQARHPEIIRVILSGHAAEDALIRAVGPAHQYLSKPCDPEALVSTIRRATALRAAFKDERLTRLVARMNCLPSPPGVYREIMAELRSEEPSIRNIAEIVGRDVAMSAKVLQLVNSAFFGLSHTISDTAQAIMHLGVDTVRSLALTSGVFTEVDRRLQGLLDLDALLMHSSQVAAIAKAIAEAEGAARDVRDACFQAGFLHDIGKLVLAASLPEQYAELLTQAQTDPGRTEAEDARFGSSHAEIGGYLLGIWGLPDAVVEAVMFHHRPSDFVGTGFSPLLAVHIADRAQRAASGTPATAESAASAERVLAQAGLTERLPAWNRIAQKTLQTCAP